jgi:zinc protease
MGYEKDIARMPRMLDYSRRFFARHYRPDNSLVIVAGDVEADAALGLVERYFSPWKKGHVPAKIPREPEQTAERRVEVRYAGRTLPVIVYAYKLPAFDADSVEWASSEVLAELSFGETSSLYNKLVLEDRSVQSLSASAGRNRDPGLFTIIAEVSDPAKLGAVEAALEAAVEEARTKAPEPARVAETVSHLRYGFLLSLDRPAAVAGALARLASLTGDLTAYERLDATRAKVTAETVRAAAAAILDAKRRTVGVLLEKTP